MHACDLHTTPYRVQKEDNFCASPPYNLEKVAGAKPAKSGFSVILVFFWAFLGCEVFFSTVERCTLVPGSVSWISSQEVGGALQ